MTDDANSQPATGDEPDDIGSEPDDPPAAPAVESPSERKPVITVRPHPIWNPSPPLNQPERPPGDHGDEPSIGPGDYSGASPEDREQPPGGDAAPPPADADIEPEERRERLTALFDGIEPIPPERPASSGRTTAARPSPGATSGPTIAIQQLPTPNRRTAAASLAGLVLLMAVALAAGVAAVAMAIAVVLRAAS
ncbi:MAG TPA: hypothetical protein VGA13_09525 [Acidimicrobiales bacterium]|jgi:hypothetical protein